MKKKERNVVGLLACSRLQHYNTAIYAENEYV